MSVSNVVRLNTYTTDVDALLEHSGVIGERTGAAPLLSRNSMGAPETSFGRGRGYFLDASKCGLVPEAWSVTSTTRLISGTASVMATSTP